MRSYLPFMYKSAKLGTNIHELKMQLEGDLVLAEVDKNLYASEIQTRTSIFLDRDYRTTVDYGIPIMAQCRC